MPNQREGTGRRAVLFALLALAALVVELRWTVLAGDAGSGGVRLITGIGLLWLTFAAGSLAVRRSPPRVAVPLLIAGGVILQLVAMSSPARLTDDYYRYAWDGRVQAAGISPYRYPPTDPALAALRTDWLFPPGCSRVNASGASTVCTRLNHPDAPTIYPPVAQAEFLAVHLLTAPLGPDGGRERTWQVLGALLATATTLALVRLLRRRGDPRQAVIWAWCPTVLLECGGNGHLDALSALLVVLAVGLAAKRAGLAGLSAAAAVATKLLPVLVLPALIAPTPGWRDGAAAWRGWFVERRLLLGAGLLTLVVVYLPHLLTVGPRVLGFLPAYLPEEGYDGQSSSRFPLLRWLPGPWSPAVAVLLILALAVLIARHPEDQQDGARPWSGAMVVTGLSFAVLGISYPWYALLLVPLAALDGRSAWTAIAAAAYPVYLAPGLHWSFTLTSQLGYLGALLLIGVTARRTTAGGRRFIERRIAAAG